ncbi:MAG: hypothetical protein H0T92_16560 [Pyrinomonadaceae bacterium]|jgi:hypothetical protein|nr:hypothetical protein [Pyrinomonadaceae bacterium]
MTNEIKRREPGKRVFPSRPQLVLVPPPEEPIRPDVRTELSPEVKEMLREMNRRHTATTENHGWTFQRESQDLMVFYPRGAEAPQAS